MRDWWEISLIFQYPSWVSFGGIFLSMRDFHFQEQEGIVIVSFATLWKQKNCESNIQALFLVSNSINMSFSPPKLFKEEYAEK